MTRYQKWLEGQKKVGNFIVRHDVAVLINEFDDLIDSATYKTEWRRSDDLCLYGYCWNEQAFLGVTVAVHNASSSAEIEEKIIGPFHRSDGIQWKRDVGGWTNKVVWTGKKELPGGIVEFEVTAFDVMDCNFKTEKQVKVVYSSNCSGG